MKEQQAAHCRLLSFRTLVVSANKFTRRWEPTPHPISRPPHSTRGRPPLVGLDCELAEWCGAAGIWFNLGGHVATRGRIRLHCCGCRCGRMRARGAPQRRPAGTCAAARSRRRKPGTRDSYTRGILEAIQEQHGLELLHGARAARAQPATVLAARKSPGRIQLDQRDDLYSWEPPRLRTLEELGQ